MKFQMTVRKLVVIDIPDSQVSFDELLSIRSTRKGSFFFRAFFKPWVTVIVPKDKAHDYPSRYVTMDDRPIWKYQIICGMVHALQPMESI